MDLMREPGRDLPREIAAGERAEAERRLETRRRAENRAGWYGWHMARAELYGRMSREHAAAAEGLLGEDTA